ncbi:MAG: hypothetical protein PHG75_04750 [Syntrophomonas sp.]|nr:hypothetical protein [Syntrophomonas sp.]
MMSSIRVRMGGQIIGRLWEQSITGTADLLGGMVLEIVQNQVEMAALGNAGE